jgi:hypothetical protein
VQVRPIQVSEFRTPAPITSPTGPQPGIPATPPFPVTSPPSTAIAAVPYPTNEDCKAHLMWLSLGKEKVGGKWENKNPRQVAVDMRLATLQHMVARGEFFRVGSGSYYLDKTASCIMPVSLTSPGLRKLLWRLGYVPKTGFTAAILESIVDHAALAPKRPYHRVAYMGKDALYIRASDNTMLRIKADKITEVPLGTDDVILIANDLASWPSLEELKPLIEEMRSRIGKTCTQIRPDLPLSHHLTTRWSTDSPLSPEQAHQLFIARFMFIFAAARYSL